MPLPQEGKKYTYKDYLTWPEDERLEIIDGIAYMQAAPTPLHQEMLMELSKQFAVYLTGKPCKVYPAPFAVILSQGSEKDEEEINNVVEPDIAIVCDLTKMSDKGCHGAPDMIIEIISPSSIKTDRVTKLNKYEKAGVREYWIVEPEQKLVSVFLQQANNRFGRPDMYTEEDRVKVSIFSDLIIDLREVFASV